MTDLRDLLREAAATVDVAQVDGAERVRRGVALRRRAHMTLVGAIAAVAVAVAAPLTVVGAGSTAGMSSRPSPPHTQLDTWAPDDSQAAVGYGAVWALKCCSPIIGRSWVDELDPSSGKQLARITLPTPASHVAVGVGYVWVIGSNPGGGGPSAITAIDPTTRHTITMHIADPYAEPYDIAFADGAAWVTMQLENAVWKLTPDQASATLAKTVVRVPGAPTDIATTGDGELWVQELTPGRIVEIDPAAARLDGPALKWTADLYGPVSGLPEDLLVVTHSRGMNNTYAAVNPSAMRHSQIDGRACNDCTDWAISSSGSIQDVVSTARGAFIWETRSHDADYTYFLSNWDLHGGLGRTTARLPYGGELAADGDGVVIGTTTGLVHWVPIG